MAKDIESLIKDFAKDLDKACADLRKARIDKNKKDKKGADDPPVITWALDSSKVSKGRTPEEQAAEVVAGKSWVCWGAHMADAARHVVMKVDGKINWDPKKALGDDFDAFKKKWASAMKDNGLKNAKGQDGWFDGDAFHLELPESKLDKSDKRVTACFEEYAKLTRKDGKSQNDKFEKEYSKDLEPYVSKYEKK
jgi:hypothetical protein